MARADDETIAMTDAERAAHVEGYMAGSEAQVRAHDPLLGVIVAFTWALRFWPEDDAHVPEVRAALRLYHERVLAIMHEVERVRFGHGAAVESAVELRLIERAVQAAEGVER
jgi:hypothetical protein